MRIQIEIERDDFCVNGTTFLELPIPTTNYLPSAAKNTTKNKQRILSYLSGIVVLAIE